MSDARVIRVFISSPADVRPERLKAEHIIARLGREFSYHFHVEAVLWEREPLVASRHFQDPENIPQPRRMDIVVVILWSRLGVVLPADFRGAISGEPVTGTEWEFEDALAGARATGGVPDLLLYRKTAEPVSGLGNPSLVRQRLEQLDMVEKFIGRWFRSADEQSFVAASHSFAATAEFEDRLYEHLRALLERHARPPTRGIAIRWHHAPYRGLLSFDYEHSPIFFGRTRARNELRELLARRENAGCAFVLALGASGSGKSSVIKAGLLPDLMLPGMIGQVGLVRRGLMRPSDAGGDPLAALAAAILSPEALPELQELSYTPGRLRALLARLPEEARLPIEQGLSHARKAADLSEIAEARLVIIIDQLEELFTIESLDQSERDAFVAALEALGKSGLVWIVATMRSDFFDRLETMPMLAALSAEARFLLLSPTDAEIAQIIRQPALEAGLRFEFHPALGVGLDEIIRQAATAETGTLPLLSFLLDQLWRRRGDRGLLTLAAYEELGGLEGAIGHRAEEIFLEQPDEVRKELVPLLRNLTTVEGGKPVSRAVALSRFPAGSPRRVLIDAFLDPAARLLVADGDPGGAQLRLAHEALLSHWSRARDQVAADIRDLELRGRLEQEAERWRTASRRDKPRRVATGLLLAEARALVTGWGKELPDAVTEFVAASRRAATERRFRLGAIVFGAVATPPMIAFLIWAGMVWSGVRAVEAEMDAAKAFAAIPAGCFDMGSVDSDHDYEAGRYHDEGPQHRVCPAGFELDKFDVTRWQWRQVMVFINPDPSNFKIYDNQPIESVSWNQVQFFIRLMSFFGRHHYRLPSEAEWEYAARAGTSTSRYWGDDSARVCDFENVADLSLRLDQPNISAVFAKCDDHYEFTAPIGSYTPNPWGLYDMLGNVSVWVEDCYVDNYREAPTDGSAVVTSDCTDRVIRGGNWRFSPQTARAADRSHLLSGVANYTTGFRLVRMVSGQR